MDNGPGLAWLRNPKAGHIAQQLGAFCRYGTGLGDDIVELTICVTARYWSQPYEWWVHHPLALMAGVDSRVLDAVEDRRELVFATEKQRAAHDLTKELLETKKASALTYKRALGIFGEKRLVELTQVIGYYSNLALQMNCFEVTPPSGGVALKDPIVG
jgi:4-carboxymuconolactone decarboxylase